MHAVTTETFPTRHRRRVFPLGLAAVLMAACGPRAEPGVPLPVRGDTVRITAGQTRAVHEFRELRGDVLVVEGEDSLLRFPIASVDGLEALVGHGNRIGNAVTGLGVGLLLGSCIGAAVGGASTCEPDAWFCDQTYNTVAAAVLLGTVGSVIGFGIGANRSTRIWQPVESTRLDVRTDASPDGLALRVSWRP